ncbi:GGDEF and EAL domain-containing protein [Vibrio rhizosphaerae]|uniref:GGDEF and EAL domain-containing protein n=1 Tax=Vibrio rhizosphaerae TaxID=398736 RepID=A0ABU4IYG2_9VIBR|nr:GGDEF and EAL domain-containing protein [Vibrio rhizosphaerae]MDW6093953.1 GGDEF and EAL domain-containing protein [Vibrio rhizosphaerae]
MPNNHPNHLIIPEHILDNWQNIVDLAAGILSSPTVMLLRCREGMNEQICHNHHTTATLNLDELSASQLHQIVLESGQPIWVSDIEEEPTLSTYLPDTVMSYAGLPLYFPNRIPFGMLVVIDSQIHHFHELEFQLLENFQSAIESHLKILTQQSEINRLNHYIENTLSHDTVDYVNLTQTLNQEIDRRKVVERQLQYNKRHDPSTGFLNRFALEDELKNRLEKCAACGEKFAVIHIGFSNARHLQTRFGYQEWENVLKHYHAQFESLELENIELLTARPNSTDLALIVQSSQLKRDVDILCEKLVLMSKAVFHIHHQSIHLHAYIGIAISGEDTTVTGLLEQASTAMISCKDSGHLYYYHSEALAQSQLRLHQLENYLLHAVRNGDLMLYFQPKVCPTTRLWTGAEALLRWRHPVLGEISSETLIHLAEKNGLIFEVGNFVLKTAIEKASQWTRYLNDFKIAVNVSAKQLRDIRFVEQVKQFLQAYQLPAHHLEIEVTESGLITDEKVAGDILQILHELGITLSLDDFGTGYASFSYLKKFPFDCIKIDKSFVHALEESDEDKEIVRSIIQVAKKLKLQIIIEGVETEAQEQFIIAEGCDYGQGFLYGRPVPADVFEDRLAQQMQSQLRQIN